MKRESYEYYLQLLKIPRDASDEVVRTAIVRELRIWTHRTNSHKLEVRQQAERMMAALEGAGEILLTPERQVWAQRHGEEYAAALGGPADSPVEPDLLARFIEQVATLRGQRFQERKGAAIYKRTAFFHKGVDYVLEELTHKKYQAELDFKRCCAFQNAMPLFDWHSRSLENPGRGNIKLYIPGAWITELIAIGREIDQANVKA
jgi:hypothetical protein